MKAVVMQGLRQPLVVETVADPAPATGELVVRVGRCGICGSDLHMTEDPAFHRKAGDVLGHEFAGEVVALGRGVEGFVIGDRVAVVPLGSCGHCPSCLAGEPAWCPQMRLQGGGYAEYAVTDPRQCVRLPASASMADGAIIEPLAVALHGVLLAEMKAGDKVLVLGAGPIGLAVAFWARRLGAARVVVQDIVPNQHDRA
ncbi:MAG: zinc-dependent alcohol dehydrogenase, partial [Janthinobacterium lividum]